MNDCQEKKMPMWGIAARAALALVLLAASQSLPACSEDAPTNVPSDSDSVRGQVAGLARLVGMRP